MKPNDMLSELLEQSGTEPGKLARMFASVWELLSAKEQAGVYRRYLGVPMPRTLRMAISPSRVIASAPGRVTLAFKTEREANSFEDRAKSAVGIYDDEEDSRDYASGDVSSVFDPRKNEYRVTVEWWKRDR